MKATSEEETSSKFYIEATHPSSTHPSLPVRSPASQEHTRQGRIHHHVPAAATATLLPFLLLRLNTHGISFNFSARKKKKCHFPSFLLRDSQSVVTLFFYFRNNCQRFLLESSSFLYCILLINSFDAEL